MKTSTRKSTDS